MKTTNEEKAAARPDLPAPSFSLGRPKLNIWDFDGTLFRSPGREEGEIAYQAHTGQPWPYQGWWGRPETLQPPILPEPIPKDLLIQKVFDAYNMARADDNVWNVLLTGRPIRLRRRVREICDYFQIYFDEEYYKGMRGIPSAEDTFDYKAGIIKTRLLHNELECVSIWEDRSEHVGRFTALAGEIKALCGKTLTKVVINDVTAGEIYEL